MSKHLIDIDKAYISPYDKLLYQLDHDLPKTASQRKEIEKHRKIAEARDKKIKHSAL